MPPPNKAVQRLTNAVASICVGGDFDLSEAVTKAVTGRRNIAEGEIRRQGFRTRAKEAKAPCHNLLRYKLTIGYV